jgi:glycine cleavage system regulatory protein
MRCSLILGVMSDDRTGIIESLSSVISRHGGEWTESKMVTMSSKFAGILLVEIPCAEEQALITELSSLGSHGLKVIAERIDQQPEASVREFCLEMVGQDRKGIIRDITRLLAKYDISMDELESRVESASMSGEALFIANAVLHIPAQVDLDRLQEDFEMMANELMVDIKLTE